MKTRIGFIYYTFFPVTGGASVHGYNLAKELNRLGYELWKLNGLPDPWTVKQPQGLKGLIRILRHCDILYIRMDYFLNFRNLIAIAALLSGRPVIAELNSPSDELHLFGRGKRYIRMIDRLYRFVLGRFDAVIVVSPGIDEWCRSELGLTNTYIVENGGERFDRRQAAEFSGLAPTARSHDSAPDSGQTGDDETGGGQSGGGETRNVSAAEVPQIAKIRKQYETVIVWSGSTNEMQDLEWLKLISEKLEPNQALMLAIFDTRETSTVLPGKENIYQFRNPPRESVRQIILNADIGLAFYNSYPWSRWGFYNSPLKIHEYLVNGLLAITNIDGSPVQKAHPLFRQVGSVEDVQALLRGHRKDPVKATSPATPADQTHPAGSREPDRPAAAQGRTWADVALETDRIVRKVLSRKNP